ncbi:MAG TPA: RNA polymerase factor sigma-32 [Polyangium sp.]|nr:RNA polymerase factor sigma-32 [Polyangium sp.]
MATKKSEPRTKTKNDAADEVNGRGKRSAAKREAPAKPTSPPESHAQTEAHDDDAERSENESDVVEVEGEIVDGDIGLDADEASDLETVAPRSTSAGRDSDVALSRTDPLQAYLREVQRHPLLTPEEEQKLTRHYVETQDVKTAARLVTANLRLVVKLAYEYRRAYKNIMDLIQEGNIGLMQAVKRYDPYRGVKLSSYAAWWIRAYILRFILNNWRLVKLGTTQAQRKLFFNLNKEKAKLSAMGIEPTAAEIAKRLSVDESEVVDMDRRLSSGEASLDAPVGDSEGRSVARVDLLPSSDSTPDTAFESQEMDRLVRQRLNKFRETLTGKDVIIFDKRMSADEPVTLQELGDEFGVSRERVRQLEARLLSKLREYLKEELGDAVGVEG